MIDFGSLSRDEIENLIDQYIFNERNRAILKRRLLDEVKYKTLEDEFGLSERRIKDIVYESQHKLFNH